MKKWRFALSSFANDTVANTRSPQLGTYDSFTFTPIMQVSTSNSSHNTGGTVYYNPPMQGQQTQPLP